MWEFTPRQAAAFAQLADKRVKNERAWQLSIARLAAHGDGNEIRKILREWSE